MRHNWEIHYAIWTKNLFIWQFVQIHLKKLLHIFYCRNFKKTQMSDETRTMQRHSPLWDEIVHCSEWDTTDNCGRKCFSPKKNSGHHYVFGLGSLRPFGPLDPSARGAWIRSWRVFEGFNASYRLKCLFTDSDFETALSCLIMIWKVQLHHIMVHYGYGFASGIAGRARCSASRLRFVL